MPDPAIRDRYLARLGLDAAPPSAGALRALHRAHVERVSWETLWIQSGQRWGTDPAESAARIATTGRGGYCFHLNGAFSWLLGELGYDVTRHLGGVHGPDGPAVGDLGNHLVLTVRGLPDDDHPDGIWYADVGLGDAILEPLPLVAGNHRSGPFTFALGPGRAEVGEWHLDHHPHGAFAGMTWRSAPAVMTDFDADHRRLSSDADSQFVRWLVMSHRDATGGDLLTGLYYRRVGDDPTSAKAESESELFAIIGDVFGTDVAAIPPEVRRAVWDRTEAAHRAAEAARAGTDDT